ncbi:penicillin-binding transpeptidase domain-containing protein [Actinocorallia lasiicapitis]
MKWFAGFFALVVLAGGGFFAYDRYFTVKGSPQQTADAYFAAWDRGDFAAMAALVDTPPPGFADQHRAFSKNLQVKSVELTPALIVEDGEQAAHADFTALRTLPPGKWKVGSTLRLAVVERRWKVLWSPDVLLPGVKDVGAVRLESTRVDVPTPVFRDGKPLAGASVASYVGGLATTYGKEGDPGWILKDGAKTLQTFGSSANELKTTLDPRAQRAADAAVAGKKAVLVAVRPSSGEVLAVADGVSGGNSAFNDRFAPGSTFKIITAAALLKSGLGPSSKVACPKAVWAGTRRIPNHDDVALGDTTLVKAFAQSCNTTFASLTHTRLQGGALRDMAEVFGFERAIAYGAARAGFPVPANNDELVEDALGQGRVQATPLSMAVVAASVANGTWRSPRLFDAKVYAAQGEQVPADRPMPGLVATLRPMMAAVVTGGTAAGAGLPAGTFGKTGTAEYNQTGDAHAWFVGYRGDVAFAVLVPGGGSGGAVAAPLAAAFLRAL